MVIYKKANLVTETPLNRPWGIIPHVSEFPRKLAILSADLVPILA